MTRKELEKNMRDILLPVAPEDWLVERCCDLAELYAKSINDSKPIVNGNDEKKSVYIKAIKAIPIFPIYADMLSEIPWEAYINQLRIEWVNGYKAATNQKSKYKI